MNDMEDADMLQSLILPMKIGVSYGSGALKALQNESMPELDLLVREAIQNSSDAAIGLPDESCKLQNVMLLRA